MAETNLSPESTPVSPDQMTLLPENPAATVSLDIPHNAEQPAPVNVLETAATENVAINAASTPAQPEIPATVEPVMAENAPVPATATDEVSSGTKIKIIAALLIVGIAGYIAYWVQEPLQIKADVTSPATTTDTSKPVADASLPTDSSTSTSGGTAATDTTTTATTPTTTTTTAATVTGPSKNVDVSLFGFEPATLQIDKGTTVIWTNTSTEDQTIIGSSTNGQSFASPVLTAGQTFNYMFDQDGTFEYYSTYNPALKASITVGTGTAAATTSAPATETTSPAATTPAGGPTLAPAAAENTEATAGNVLTSAISETSAQEQTART